MIVGPSMPTPMTSRMPGTPAAAISWLVTTWCSGPSPCPPNSAGHVVPLSPPSVSFACQARRAAISASASICEPPLFSGASALCSSSQLRTLARCSASSGVSFRSIVAERYRLGRGPGIPHMREQERLQVRIGRLVAVAAVARDQRDREAGVLQLADLGPDRVDVVRAVLLVGEVHDVELPARRGDRVPRRRAGVLERRGVLGEQAG